MLASRCAAGSNEDYLSTVPVQRTYAPNGTLAAELTPVGWGMLVVDAIFRDNQPT